MSPTSMLEAEETSVAEPSQARWVRQRLYDPWLREQLDLLRGLQTGWDGYQAPPPARDIIDAVGRFINEVLSSHFVPRPTVVPTMSGGVQLEWHKGTRSLELEFESSDRIHYLRWDPQREIEDEEFIRVDDRSQADMLIRWFSSPDA
jgi:hypothetical protein